MRTITARSTVSAVNGEMDDRYRRAQRPPRAT